MGKGTRGGHKHLKQNDAIVDPSFNLLDPAGVPPDPTKLIDNAANTIIDASTGDIVYPIDPIKMLHGNNLFLHTTSDIAMPDDSYSNLFIGVNAGVNIIPDGGAGCGCGCGCGCSGGGGVVLSNVGIGAYALNKYEVGNYNTAVGSTTLASITTSNNNTAIGHTALNTILAGNENTAVGSGSMADTAYSANNTGVGYKSLFGVNGSGNVAIGNLSAMNTEGTSNTAVGSGSMVGCIGGVNTAIGSNALSSDVTGIGNTAIGHYALQSCNGNSNVVIGDRACMALVGHYNVAIMGGNNAFFNNIADNCLVIGSPGTTLDNNTESGLFWLGGLLTGNTITKKLKLDTQVTAPPPSVVNSVGGFLDIDSSLTNFVELTLTENVTINFINKPLNGDTQKLIVQIKQSFALYSITFAAGFIFWPDNTPPIMSQVNQAHDLFEFVFIGSKVYGNVIGQNYPSPAV